MALDLFTIILRFAIVFFMASMFGLDRQRSHKPIGFGTFIFVSAGACALAIIAISLYPENPLSLLGAIVTGIGFLGAGALIKTTDKIFGFTTAASIWTFAVLGLVIGVGEYIVGIILYSVIWIVIVYDKYLEMQGIGSYQKKLTVHTNRMVSNKDVETILLIHTRKHKLIDTVVDKKNGLMTLVYLIEGSRENINKVPKIFYEKEWLESIRIE